MSDKRLARYVVSLEAETAKYQKGLEEARNKLGRFEKSQAEKIGRMAKQFGALAATAGAAFGALVKQSINSQDSLSKLSQTVGISTEALSQLQFAGDLSGTSMEQLSGGLLRLSRAASDSANGLSTAQRAFAAIGVEAQNSDGTLKNTEQLLLEVAEQFSGIEDGAAKAAVAQELFGRSGAQLIPFLNQGKDGIQALREEADRLGLTIGTDAAKSAEQFNDNITRLQSSFKGLVAQSAQRLLPTFEAISDRIVDSLASTDGMARAVDGLEAAFKSLVSTGIVVASVFKSVGTLLGAAAAAVVQRDLGIIREAYEDIVNDVSGMFDDVASVWGPAIERAATEIEKPAERIRRALEFGADEGGEASVDGLSDAAKRAAQIFEQTRTDFEKNAAALNEAHELWKQGLLDDETYWRFVDGLEKMYEQAAEVVEESVSQMTVFAEQAASNMQDAFADFLFDPFEDGLKGMLRGFLDTMRRMAAELASQQILSAIFGGLSGSTNPALAAFGAAFGGARAAGGPVMGGKSYLVGEKGPELVTMGGSGFVTPNHALGGGVTFNIDARGADAQIVRALPAILEQHAQRIKGDIAMSMNRGRAFA